jgi:hypothetical protein
MDNTDVKEEGVVEAAEAVEDSSESAPAEEAVESSE